MTLSADIYVHATYFIFQHKYECLLCKSTSDEKHKKKALKRRKTSSLFTEYHLVVKKRQHQINKCVKKMHSMNTNILFHK